jgi:dihydroorotate dehydrogenase electron transfer subunit
LSDSPIEHETMRTRLVVEAVWETEKVRTLYFVDELCNRATPGQYVMVWVPGVDEVPMSLSTIDMGGRSSITVGSVGDATEILCSLETDDKIGVRGPFGNGFKLVGSSPLIVAGGTGAATLTPLVEEMVVRGARPTFVLGARSIDGLLLRSRLETLLGDKLLLTTDDGSQGFKGLASDYAKSLMEELSFDFVYTCGPELMIAAIFEEAEKKGIQVQVSLERYIKCAVGLCGSCALGPYRVCRDGPVFNSVQLREVQDEFGKRRMDPSGRMVKVSH